MEHEIDVEEEAKKMQSGEISRTELEADRARGRMDSFSEDLQLAAEKAAEHLAEKEANKAEAAKKLEEMETDGNVN